MPRADRPDIPCLVFVFPVQGDCVPEVGCVCHAGWQGDDCSEPVDECEEPVVHGLDPTPSGHLFPGGAVGVSGACLARTPFDCVYSTPELVRGAFLPPPPTSCLPASAAWFFSKPCVLFRARFSRRRRRQGRWRVCPISCPYRPFPARVWCCRGWRGAGGGALVRVSFCVRGTRDVCRRHWRIAQHGRGCIPLPPLRVCDGARRAALRVVQPVQGELYRFPADHVGGRGLECPLPPGLPPVLFGNGSSCAVAPFANLTFTLLSFERNMDLVWATGWYTLTHCGDSEGACGVGGQCAQDGTCICAFDRCGALCDAPANVTGTCTLVDKVRRRAVETGGGGGARTTWLCSRVLGCALNALGSIRWGRCFGGVALTRRWAGRGRVVPQDHPP
jgi:hypothetical protein